MPEPSLSEVRSVAILAARTGGQVLAEGLGRVQQVRHKGEIDLVTDVDLRAEAAIVTVLRERFPTHSVLAEEGTLGGPDPEHRWIIDPLDGTTNFAHGFPFFCVSVAYTRRGESLVGVVYDPVHDELFVGVRGAEATLNGQPLAVSTTPALADALLATGFPYERARFARALHQFGALSLRAQAVRRAGSAALDAVYVAAGRFDGYWETVVFPWDVAAGALIVQEAGGVVTNLAGEPFSLEQGEILAANPALHGQIVAALREADATGPR